MIVAPWKFDVVKTSIFALEASLLGQIFVLRTSISAGQLSADSSSTETLFCLNSSSTETLYCLNSGPPWMNTIASRDQFKPIRIGEKLVVNYNTS